MNKIKAEKFFLVFSIIFGIIICFLTPYGGGYDELTITARIWEISHFDFIPNDDAEGIVIPAAFHNSSYRARFFFSPFTTEEINLKSKIVITPDQMSKEFTRSVYFPILYLPSAFIIGFFARVLNNIPIMFTLYLLKIFNLFIYILFVFISIKIIPFGKNIVSVIALTPMVLFQTISVSYYYLLYGIIFFYISYIFYLATKNSKISIKEFWLLLFLIFMIIASKPDSLILIFLLFILPIKKIFIKWQTIFLLTFIIVNFIFIVIGWNLLIYQNYIMNSSDTNMFRQSFFIISNPITYIKAILHDLQINGINYVKGWIGDYGYTGSVPLIVYPLFLILIFLVSIFDNTPPANIGKNRVFLLVFSFINYFFTITVLYVIMSKVGSTVITDIHGKFFFVSGLLFFLSISGFINKKNRYIRLISFILVFLVLSIYSLGLYLSYYTYCGPNLYISGLCYLPKYKNWAPETYTTGTLNDNFALQQTFVSECSGLSEIRILLAENSSISGKIILKLFDRTSEELISMETIQPKPENLGSWISLQLTHPISSQKSSYIITVQPYDATDTNFIFSTAQRDEYLDGDLKINGKYPDTDLLFQYGCDVHFHK